MQRAHRTGTPYITAIFGLAFLPAAIAWAGVEPTPFRTGLFGVTPEQTIRISVVNTGGAAGTIVPRIVIRDLAGTPLAELYGRSLAEGTGSVFDIGAASLGAASSSAARLPGTVTRATRTQVRADAWIEYVPVAADGSVVPDDEAAVRALRRRVRVTLEIVDVATARTVYTMPFEAVGFDPQPDPPMPQP